MKMLETLKALFRDQLEEDLAPVPVRTAREYRALSAKFLLAAMYHNPGSEHQARMAMHLLAKAIELETTKK